MNEESYTKTWNEIAIYISRANLLFHQIYEKINSAHMKQFF